MDVDFVTAQALVERAQKHGELDELTLLEFAKKRKYAATITALAALCSAPIDMIKQMLSEGRNDALLFPCKTAGFSWPTLRALLQDDLLGRVASDDDLKKLKSDYTKLSQSTARKLLDFWCEHHATHKT